MKDAISTGVRPEERTEHRKNGRSGVLRFGLDSPVLRNAEAFVKGMLLQPIPSFSPRRQDFDNQIRNPLKGLLGDDGRTLLRGEYQIWLYILRGV